MLLPARCSRCGECTTAPRHRGSGRQPASALAFGRSPFLSSTTATAMGTSDTGVSLLLQLQLLHAVRAPVPMLMS